MFRRKMHGPWWAKEGDGGGSGNGDSTDDSTTDPETTTVTPEGEDFEAWLEANHPDIFSKYEGHVGNLLSALRKERTANKESKQKLARLKELEEAEQLRQTEEQSEVQKLAGERDDLKSKYEAATANLEKLRIDHALISAASGHEFQNPNDVLLFVDRSELEIDEEGNVVGAEAAVKAVVKARPYLIVKKLTSGNDTSDDSAELDKGPKAKKKIKEAQPKIPI